MPKYGEAERALKKAPAAQEVTQQALTKGDVQAAIAALERENGLLRQQAADLDEMPRKRRTGMVSDLKGIEDLHTSITKRVRSMPGGEDKLYLELYLLQKEQLRLQKETTWVKKRRTRIGHRFEDNTKEIATREQDALEGMSVLQEQAFKVGGQEPATSQERKHEHRKEGLTTMPLEYGR